MDVNASETDRSCGAIELFRCGCYSYDHREESEGKRIRRSFIVVSGYSA